MKFKCTYGYLTPELGYYICKQIQDRTIFPNIIPYCKKEVAFQVIIKISYSF
jgi:hypothetical protein